MPDSQGGTVEDLLPVPASVKTVLRKLDGHPPMTSKELREATGLPRRTVYTALRRLRELGLLQERQSLKDTRQTYFWIAEPHPWAHPQSPSSSPVGHEFASGLREHDGQHAT